MAELPDVGKFWWGSILMAGGLLAAVVGGLHYARAPDALAITATLAVSALCVIAVINSGVRAVHASLAVLIAVTEWVFAPPRGVLGAARLI